MIATLTSIALWWSSLLGLVAVDAPDVPVPVGAWTDNEVDPPASASSAPLVMARARRLRLFPDFPSIDELEDSRAAGLLPDPALEAYFTSVPPALSAAARTLPPLPHSPRYPERSRALLF